MKCELDDIPPGTASCAYEIMMAIEMCQCDRHVEEKKQKANNSKHWFDFATVSTSSGGVLTLELLQKVIKEMDDSTTGITS